MKIHWELLIVGCLLLVWSMTSEAHSSAEAMSQAASVAEMTLAIWHPLLETPIVFGLLLVGLMLVLIVLARLPALIRWLYQLIQAQA